MQIVHSLDDSAVAATLLAGGIGVIRTDTLYGVVCRADDEKAVERVYQLKGRDDNKSPIVLIADQSMLFDAPSPVMRDVLESVWPGKVSVIIPSHDAPAWLARGNGSVAYRLPNDPQLQALVTKTGPLIAPSANPQGEEPAYSCQAAVDYFGDKVDVYVDGGTVTDLAPSQLLAVADDGTVERLR